MIPTSLVKRMVNNSNRIKTTPKVIQCQLILNRTRGVSVRRAGTRLNAKRPCNGLYRILVCGNERIMNPFAAH